VQNLPVYASVRMMNNFSLYTIASIFLGVLILIPLYANAQVQLEPIVAKIGSCPSGWGAAGNYCRALSNAKPIVPKIGSCPSGWGAAGSYCRALSNAKPIIPKTGSCPSGWGAAGNYCRKF